MSRSFPLILKLYLCNTFQVCSCLLRSCRFVSLKYTNYDLGTYFCQGGCFTTPLGAPLAFAITIQVIVSFLIFCYIVKLFSQLNLLKPFNDYYVHTVALRSSNPLKQLNKKIPHFRSISQLIFIYLLAHVCLSTRSIPYQVKPKLYETQ